MAGRSSRGASGRRKAPVGTALDAGIRLLARRAHSRAELQRKLIRRGFEPEATDAAVATLARSGYLDDGAFARGLVRRRSRSRGPLALAAELAAKGIEREGVAAALAEVDEADQVAVATRLAERLYAANPSPGYRETLATVGAKLARRGFPAGVVRAACRAVLSPASD